METPVVGHLSTLTRRDHPSPYLSGVYIALPGQSSGSSGETQIEQKQRPRAARQVLQVGEPVRHIGLLMWRSVGAEHVDGRVSVAGVPVADHVDEQQVIRPGRFELSGDPRAQRLSCQRVFGYRNGLIAELLQGGCEVRYEFGGEGEGFQRRAARDRLRTGYADGECPTARTRTAFRICHCSPYPQMNG